MKKVVFDFETFYDSKSGYTLRKMTPVEYILDPRFEIIGCAVKEDGNGTFWLEEPDLARYLRQLPDKVLAISHNALFDMSIMAWRMNWLPALMADTLGMARAMLAAQLKSLALAQLARYLGIGEKGGTVHKVDGMSLAAIKFAGLYDEYVDYSLGDADLCWAAFQWMVKEGFPASEIGIMDMVLRACIEPGFVMDQQLLAEHLQNTLAKKAALLARTGMANRDDLMSNDRFAAVLEGLGVDVPMKTSLTTGKETFAFAKTDPEFLALEEHPNPEVQALVSARLGIKSTIEETRTERLIRISQLTWPGNLGIPPSSLPVALKFSGAHTHRFGGDWKLNMQNLPVRKDNTIRRSIKAPQGKKIIVVDASQIEARLVAWFCGCTILTDGFRAGKDIYSEFASDIFGRLINKKDNPSERFVGKQAILGLGYNLGWIKFQKKVALDSLDQTGTEIVLDDMEAQRVVTLYRTKYKEIPAVWKWLQSMIERMTHRDLNETHGPITFMHEKIRLPNGLYLYFHNLRYEGDGWRFDYNGETKYIYGGKLLENIIQALARIIIMDAAARIRRILHIKMKLQVHDELVYVEPEFIAEAVKEAVIEQLRIPPAWGPEIPLDAEGDIADSYGDAK